MSDDGHLFFGKMRALSGCHCVREPIAPARVCRLTNKEIKRVLIVDDDAPIRKLLTVVLHRRGIASDCAVDGVEGWAKLERCHYALILLDLMMPRMSGYEVLEKLSALPAGLRPPVVVLTAGAKPTLRPDLVLTLIRKPFDLDVVADVVLAALESVPVSLQPHDCPEAESDGLFSRPERNVSDHGTN